MKIYSFVIFLIFYISFNFAVAELTLNPGPVTCEYKKKDTNEDYNANSDINIKCDSLNCVVSNNNGVSVSNDSLIISAAGTYIIEGILNGQILIKVTKDDFVHLVLNGVSVSSNDGPAIYATEVDKVTITLVGENTITDTTKYSNVVDEEPDACLFIDGDLSINGSGSLTVTGNYSDGIRCKKDLKLVSGNIKIASAVQRGIKARNSICIKDGTIDVNSINSGIKVTKDTDASKGYIVVDGGNITVSTEKDAIHAETHLTIRNGYVNILKSKEGIEGQMIDILGGEVHVLATDDGINASKITNSTETESNNGPNGMGGMPEIGTDGNIPNNTNSTEFKPSYNGPGGGGMPEIGTDGNFSNNTNSTKFKPSHNGGPGGMGGGMPGGMPETGTDGSVYINIVGGKTYVTVDGMDVDGIDSNGVLYIGGEAEVYASVSSGDIYGNMAALDSEGTNAIVNGATVIATAGSMGGMGGMGGKMNNKNKDKRQESDTQESSSNPGGQSGQSGQGSPSGQNGQGFPGSQNGQGFPGGQNGQGFPGGMNEEGTVYQPYIKTSVDSQNAGTQITVKDSNNNVIASYTPNVSYSSILVTSPSMKAGESYTIITGDTSLTATASEAVSGSPDAPSVLSPTDTSVSINTTSDGITIRPHILTFTIIFLSFIFFF